LLSTAFKRVLISGQIGADPQGVVADGIGAQMRQALANLVAVVAAAGLEARDVVKLVAYCVEPGQVALFRAVREECFGSHAPACTYVEVAGLAAPEFLFEVEGEAVREASAPR
jgi:enamine deaminase RidA (YjgF/YER057c/UK114 family)